MIRAAQARDHAAIAALLRAAFGGAHEATLVEALRAEGAVMAELVAERDGAVIGQVMASAASIAGRRVAALAPLAVAAGARREGIGAALVSAVLARCAEAGADAVLVLGEPGYYGRFGFSAVAAARVEGVSWAGHPAFQALVLRGGNGPVGAVRYACAFGQAGQDGADGEGGTPMSVIGLPPYDEKNIFARILRGEIPCKKQYEDEFALAFHDINPQTPVHVLVIPRGAYVSHADFTLKASAQEIAGFWRAVGHVARELGLESDGYRILSNVGADGGQEVPHFHVHIFGGRRLGRMVPKAES